MSAVHEPAASLRPMTAADVEEVGRLERFAYRFPWTEEIFSDCLRTGYCCWVLEIDENIEGYGVMSVGAGESHILNLCVHDAVRRRGFGRLILRHLLSLARSHSADAVFLEVRPSNAPALRLYESAGFNEVGMRRGYYPADNNREDAIILARSLVG